MFDRLKGPNLAGHAANVIGCNRCEAEVHGNNQKVGKGLIRVNRIKPTLSAEAWMYIQYLGRR